MLTTKQIVALLFLTLSLPLLHAKATSSFIVEDTPRTHKRSKSRLKEDLGEALKKSLHSCSDYNKEAGAVQKKISILQSQLLEATESMIEQAPPIKNASRQTIANAIQLVLSISKTMQSQKKLLVSLQKKLDNCHCLKKKV
jgi:hypothetical protein